MRRLNMKLHEMFGPGFASALENGTCPWCDTDMQVDGVHSTAVRCSTCGEVSDVKSIIDHGADSQLAVGENEESQKDHEDEDKHIMDQEPDLNPHAGSEMTGARIRR